MADLSEYDAELAWFRQSVPRLREITLESIRGLVSSSPFPLSDEIREAISRYLETAFDVQQKVGASVIQSNFQPWLSARKSEFDFYYWSRLQRYLLERGDLPPAVVNTLDTDTDEILDYVGDPNAEGKWHRRGMVLGHVQSGKTSNYSAVICKAADVGYSIVILLAGMTNLLRQQTQERIDESFIGRQAIFGAQAISRYIGVSQFIREGEVRRTPIYGTSVDSDFTIANARNYGVTLDGIKEPIIFVTKKNVNTLRNLKTWLLDKYPLKNIPHPLLLIDDEADNASVNTSADPEKATRINSGIREILSLFNCASYIGYTATPFANIFIDPESNEEMENNDLFPADYIKALDPPTNYVGPQKVFCDGGELQHRMVRVVDDYQDILPVKHKNFHPVDELPASLLEAIRLYVLTRTIRTLRGDEKKHCSMMINVSRFNSVQESVLGEVYRYLETLKQAINVHAGLAKRGLKDPHLKTLADDFAVEFADCGATWDEVQRTLPAAVASVSARTVNMRGGALDYSRNRDAGLHVIVVGGFALSRGLTLEGLTVSYILRNASAYDTLMQMGRWFGYRPNYVDLCRLYITETSRDYYEHIADVTEELRGAIERMQQQGLTPRDFGLKVREHPDAIRITAANKMRMAKRVMLATDLSCKHVEGHSIYNSDKINNANRKLVSDFLHSLGDHHNPSNDRPQEELFWSDVDVTKIKELLEHFQLPEANFELGPNFRASHSVQNRSLLQDYVDDRSASELSRWDIVVPQIVGKTGPADTAIIPGRSLRCRTRRSGTLTYVGKVFKVTGKQKVADPDDGSMGFLPEVFKDLRGKKDRTCNEYREGPLLFVHVFEAETREGEDSPDFTEKCVSISVCLPGTEVPAAERLYQANPVWIQQMMAEPDEEEDEDQEFSEADAEL